MLPASQHFPFAIGAKSYTTSSPPHFACDVSMLTHLSDFDYDLPPERIAQTPARPRTSARLLHVQGSLLHDHTTSDLPHLLQAGDLLIVNNTKVIPAQLIAHKSTGPGTGPGEGTGKIHLTLHHRLSPNMWKAFARPAKKCPLGTALHFDEHLHAEITHKGNAGEITLTFSQFGPILDAAIDRLGSMPLPPYIKRPTPKASDKHDYQTIFARHTGAVAAPTAGLHFTSDLTAQLKAANIHLAEVTLHVGAGTFLPVKTQTIADHKMHSEWGEVSLETCDLIHTTQARKGRIICIGTTSLRILEAAYAHHGHLKPFRGETDIFIRPGFRFGVADMLLTNFHLPRSTLLMLVSAFAGHKNIFAAYHHAIDAGYRFFSYGDACLLHKRMGT